VRFGTRDLSARTLGADGSLRPTGVHGRAGETSKVRVAFLHPRQAAALVREPDVTAHRFVIDRTDHKTTCDAKSSPPQPRTRIYRSVYPN
jgi:hypothetical protein